MLLYRYLDSTGEFYLQHTLRYVTLQSNIPQGMLGIIRYLVTDRESNRSEKKAGLSQNNSLYEKDSGLSDENNGAF